MSATNTIKVRLGMHGSQTVYLGMTSEEAVVALKKLESNRDPESAHEDADAILLSVVSEEVRAAFLGLSQGFWYA